MRELIYSMQFGRVKCLIGQDGSIRTAYATELRRMLDELERHLLEAELAGGTEI
jgi:hypothetical protein